MTTTTHPEIPSERRHEIVCELDAEVCQCGAGKRSGNTFCRRCYWRLKPAVRQALYRSVGYGYEEAYEAAIAVLRGGAR